MKGRSNKSAASASDSVIPLPSSPPPTVLISWEGTAEAVSLSSEAEEREQDVVTENDLAHLLHLLEGKDGDLKKGNERWKTNYNCVEQAMPLKYTRM
ncbi:hypothetical protein F3Y22_tig00111458pilonHSYRG00037 [Hibiscus syriacus]|uniref:Uncharacterized protein n=1 Tax=Hibiscus syriacus TaxID=106335 RepID=A0A6A2YKN3_HIBSY|nr:hypothetical protein F3Y22_tig00111458pilonHSYRG00037 [Hibiscus syriacus]